MVVSGILFSFLGGIGRDIVLQMSTGIRVNISFSRDLQTLKCLSSISSQQLYKELNEENNLPTIHTQE